MPNIFNRFRSGPSATHLSLYSSTQPAAEFEIQNDTTQTSQQQQSPSKHWGLHAVACASQVARHSLEQQSCDNEAGILHKEKKKKPASLKQPLLVLRRSLLNSWINVLLVLVPLGIASRSAMLPDMAIFLINFFAIIPLAKLLGYATEQLALHLGDTLGGLLNATFGNAIELILGILALVKGKIEIVQTSLVGSILSNLLLVGGCCLFLGGIKNNEQVFSIHAAQSYGTLLAMAILATLLPAAYNLLDAKGSELKRGTLILSHVTAVLLLIIYIAYLVFQLKTHSSLFTAVPIQERVEAAQRPPRTNRVTASTSNQVSEGAATAADLTMFHTPSTEPRADNTVSIKVASFVDVNSNAEIEAKLIEAKLVEENEEEEEIELTIWASVFLLAVSTALTGMCAEFLVSSIDGLTTKWNMSPSFVGMILLPIVGNAAEHATAVTVAIRNKMDLALGVVVGSSIQIALFVMPFLCILGWIIKEPMTIYFNPFTTIVIFVSVLLVNYVIGDGRTNWLEGLILLIAYFIIGVAYFLYPKELNS
ncbi:hypothetical protein LPJ66_003598 [Kickxella alabastrina]|uniref:Uncharacterized protein n=1 Tax=Kickxella alabastrina TaxID=61397 RepID=A0ACC1ILX2_9FUNG|nr:hypothetical protein LPJ66_003598 [Kickxella alabastrina]